MQLPPHTAVSEEVLVALAEHHGLPGRVTRLPDTGIFNAIYLVDDWYVLRVPRRHPEHYRALHKESIAVPIARRLGIRTPALLVYDDSLSLLPVPYTIYERAEGETLGHLDLEPTDMAQVWREVGADLATLHDFGDSAELAVELDDRKALPDPRELAENLATQGWFTGAEARWWERWLDTLAPTALVPVEVRLSHGDMQATNIMVRGDGHEYAALLDWGSAGWGDPAWDFCAVPLRAAVSMLEGYRARTLPERDETLEARILWRQIQLALFTVERGPQPALSWAERPLSMLLDIMGFFLAHPSHRWNQVRPT